MQVQLTGDRMAALLQELIDAPEAEPALVVEVEPDYWAAAITAKAQNHTSARWKCGTAKWNKLYTSRQRRACRTDVRAIDEAMVVHHIGIADRADSYEVAKKN